MASTISYEYLNAGAPISDFDLARVAPAVFAEQPHDSRSDRYGYVRTIDIVEGMRGKGFDVVSATQAKPRDKTKLGFAKHVLRFRHKDAAVVQGVLPEVTLLNSHDGSSSYWLGLGMFRLVCANGLMVGTTFDSLRLPHTKRAAEEVIEGSFEVVKQHDNALRVVDQWSGVNMPDQHIDYFGTCALAMRWPHDDEGNPTAPITPTQLLAPRRGEDDRCDLWTVFNRAQEGMMRGGTRGWVRGKNGRLRRSTTRTITGIDQSRSINRGLWDLAERYVDLVNA